MMAPPLLCLGRFRWFLWLPVWPSSSDDLLTDEDEVAEEAEEVTGSDGLLWLLCEEFNTELDEEEAEEAEGTCCEALLLDLYPDPLEVERICSDVALAVAPVDDNGVVVVVEEEPLVVRTSDESCLSV